MFHYLITYNGRYPLRLLLLQNLAYVSICLISFIAGFNFSVCCCFVAAVPLRLTRQRKTESQFPVLDTATVLTESLLPIPANSFYL
jgi:hypothetical protein